MNTKAKEVKLPVKKRKLEDPEYRFCKKLVDKKCQMSVNKVFHIYPLPYS